MSTIFKGINDKHDRLHPQLARMGAIYSRITRSDAIKREIKKMVRSYCHF